MPTLSDSIVDRRSRFRLRGKCELILVMFVVIAGLIVTTIAVIKAKEKREILALASSSGTGRARDEPNSASTHFATVETHRQLYELARARQQAAAAGGQPRYDNRTRNNRYQAETEFHGGTTGGSADDGERHLDSEGEPSSPPRTANRQPLTPTQPVASPPESPPVTLQPIDYSQSQPRPKEIMKPDVTYTNYPAPPPFGFDPNLLFLENRKLLESVESTASILFPPEKSSSTSLAASSNKQPTATRKHGAVGRNSPQNTNSGRPLATEESEKFEIGSRRHLAFPSEDFVTSHHRQHQRAQQQLPPQQRKQPQVFTVAELENGNYLTPSELLWLQQQRPDLFRTTNGASSSHNHHPSSSLLLNRQRRDLAASEAQRSKRIHRPRYELEDDEDSDDDLEDSEPDEEPRDRRTSRSYKREQAMQRRELEQDDSDDEDEPKKPRKARSKKKTREVKKYNAAVAKRALTPSGGNKYTEESKNVEKMDILGSGNFEIIRGGIIEEDKASAADEAAVAAKKKKQATAKPKKRKKIEEANRTEKKPDEFERRSDVGPVEGDQDAKAAGKKGINQDESKPAKPAEFESPFNFDIFGNDPLLGFQGYDNFGDNRGNGARNSDALGGALNGLGL